jgi:hypothetical protein
MRLLNLVAHTGTGTSANGVRDYSSEGEKEEEDV